MEMIVYNDRCIASRRLHLNDLSCPVKQVQGGSQDKPELYKKKKKERSDKSASSNTRQKKRIGKIYTRDKRVHYERKKKGRGKKTK